MFSARRREQLDWFDGPTFPCVYKQQHAGLGLRLLTAGRPQVQDLSSPLHTRLINQGSSGRVPHQTGALLLYVSPAFKPLALRVRACMRESEREGAR